MDYYVIETSAGNLINWQTATEKDNNKYNVWRSFNPTKAFTKIVEIYSKGSGLNPTNYSFFDSLSYHQKLVYYRVVQVDFDGETVSTSVIRLKRKMSKVDAFTVFPKPQRAGEITFLLHPAREKKQVFFDLKNNAGNTLFTEEGPLQDIAEVISLKLALIPAGMYFIYLHSTGVAKVIKWIKD
ncbi:hypothetical protein [Cyclobacterium amurskyense]|uniref:Secretion system C-terminal sorting domain-containing protein n=1 Tax=Cyclobacterium amurskyense TaxID=320787 RepID=A0A0H4P929_9BACT|nr:hypothetical protein [Cyclobacterium amurskyense]AKP50659.1 hypothetical protein CA2015_1210 [Cyclobacterium amurskyense]